MEPSPTSRCPRCGAPRGPGPECPRCGVIYAKARPPAVPAAPVAVPPEPGGVSEARGAPWPGHEPAAWRGELDGARHELLVRALAPPGALLLAWALVSSGAGHALVRTFLSMWVHETGHAVAAWLSGYGAFPGPWRTPVTATRQPLVAVALAVALGALAWRGWRRRRPALVAAGATGLVAQLVCTLAPAAAARAFIVFGGDAGCMVLGAALVATLWSAPDGRLGRGGLRWGFLLIGACALVDALHTWLHAWRDHGQIPLGEIEGVGLSDASTLWQVHRWSLDAIAGRYVALGLACLAALTAAYAVALARARARVGAASSSARAG